MYGIYHYVNCINVLIYTCLMIPQLIQMEFFIRELCLLRDDYSLTDNNDNACDITKEEVSYIINHLCIS